MIIDFTTKKIKLAELKIETQAIRYLADPKQLSQTEYQLINEFINYADDKPNAFMDTADDMLYNKAPIHHGLTRALLDYFNKLDEETGTVAISAKTIKKII